MTVLIPNFIPVPDTEMRKLISITLLIAGICVTVVGVFFLFLNRREGKGQNTLAWVFICVGVLLTANHGLQLIF